MVLRPAEAMMRCSSTGTGDSPELTLDASNAVVERTVGFAGRGVVDRVGWWGCVVVSEPSTAT